MLPIFQWMRTETFLNRKGVKAYRTAQISVTTLNTILTNYLEQKLPHNSPYQ